MKLYKSTSRFLDEYTYLSNKKNKITISDLSKFDNLHYHGTRAVDFAIKKLAIDEKDLVLDIGSGIGGPARYIAYKTKCRVHAIEIQEDLNNIGKLFTKTVYLEEKIKHINNDFFLKKFKNNFYNHVVCWLSLYHLPNREVYLKKIYRIIKPYGNLYIEDFYLKKEIDSKEKTLLQEKFFSNSLVNKTDFLSGLKFKGFKIDYTNDMTNDWIRFTSKRLDEFIKNKEKNSIIHKKSTIKNILNFYQLANYLLKSGVLGGIRLNCTKS